MEVVSVSLLKDILDGKVAQGTSVSGVILVSDYSISLTKNGKEYINGNLLSGVKVPFKAWNSSTAFNKFKTEEYASTPVFVRGTVDNYNGNGSITVDDIVAVSDFTADQFLEQRYNVEAYFDGLMNILKSNISDKAMKLVDLVFTDDIKKAFKTEFAAKSHHDNCKGGLLAHTYKCVSLLNWTLTSYNTLYYLPSDNGLEVSQDRKDLLFIGTLFHDLGKIREMNLGVYQNCSKVTHRYLGTEYLALHKDMILEYYSEEWYYDLVSILLQHHGEWGDPCKTLVSYIVSKVDLFESQMTLIQQSLVEKLSTSSAGSRLNIDGAWLSVD